MRDKIWHQMIAARYKAIYLSYFNSYLRSAERWLEIVLAIASSGAVAAWFFWKAHPAIWPVIIGTAQLIKVLKPYLPFLKERDQLASSYVFYQQQHFHYESLWNDLEAHQLSEDETRQQYRDIRSRQLEEDERTSYFRVPEYRCLVRKTEQLWQEYLVTNHQIERT